MNKVNASLVVALGVLSSTAGAQVTTTNYNLSTPTISVFNDRIGNSRLFGGPNTDRVRISSFQSPSPDSDFFVFINGLGQQFVSGNGAFTTVAVTHSSFGTAIVPNPRALTWVGLRSGLGGGRNEYTTTFNRASPAVAPLLDAWSTTPFTVIANNPSVPNGITTVSTTAPTFDKDALPPFVTDLRVTGGLTPTLSWLVPSGPTPSAASIQVRIIDAESADGSRITQSRLLHVKNLPATTTSYTLNETFSNAALGFPAALQVGQRYEIAVQLDLIANGSLKGRSRTFFEYSPITTTSSGVAVYLPSVGTNGAFKFDVTVNATDSYPIDPVIAVGYIYEVGAADPNFRSVSLPDIGDGKYTVDVFDPGLGQYRPGFAASANTAYDFVAMGYPLGVAKFRVKGIEASAGLDAANTTAFVTTVGFMGSGRFTGTMLPIGGYAVAGFLPPVNLPPTVNTTKAGASLPLKWTLADKQGYAVTDLAAVSAISYKATSCTAFTSDAAGATTALAAGGSQLRYDVSAAQYVFNWKTPAAPGCYSLFVTLDTAEAMQANVMLTP